MAGLDLLWSQITDVYPILNGKIIINCLDLTDVEESVYENIHKGLCDMENLKVFNEILELEIRSFVRLQVVPKFWKHLTVDNESLNSSDKSEKSELQNFTTENQKIFDQFVVAINELYKSFQYLDEIGRRLKLLNQMSNYQHKRVLNEALVMKMFQESLLSQLPPYFNIYVDLFYSLHFRVVYRLRDSSTPLEMSTEEEMSSELQCTGCSFTTDKCCCKELSETINEINTKLYRMNLLDRIGGSSMTALVKFKIKEYIADTCHGIFERSHLKQLGTWLESVIINWLDCIYNGNNSLDSEKVAQNKEVINGFKVKLTYFLYERYAHNIIDQFFSIIIDFPESIPAIDDLKICMEKIDMRLHLITTLRSSLEARILHPGVNTMDILTGYVAAIKAIRHLDNTGVILEMVTAPIKEYLRKRSDTVRRVVTGLTEEGPTDLSEELAKGESVKEPRDAHNNEELSDWENWQPDPFGEDPSPLRYNSTKAMRTADIISMVVDIYGSKELFMVEYRNLMADRLLTQLDFKSEKEIRNLELLKIRFGEQLLHSCEVMLKDVTDSKRINNHIQSDENFKRNQLFDISTLIISAQFWPSFNKESLELPEEIENEFKKFTKSYEAYKGNRTLNWRTVTGRVNIVIEIGERTLEMTVPPTQAIIIYHFQNKSEWSLDALSSVTKVPPSALKRRISFWENHGLVSEIQPGIYKLNEEETQKPFESRAADVDDDDLESAMASASDQREEELQVFWSYIVGMLTNLDSLPIERIHQMLKLFASHGGGVEFTQDELKHFLQRKVREHKLLFSGGVYQLAK